MAELKAALESLSQKIAELHSYAVKIRLAATAVSVILLITFDRCSWLAKLDAQIFAGPRL